MDDPHEWLVQPWDPYISCVCMCYLVICFIMESVPFPSVVVVVWISQATHKLNAQHYIFTPAVDQSTTHTQHQVDKNDVCLISIGRSAKSPPPVYSQHQPQRIVLLLYLMH